MNKSQAITLQSSKATRVRVEPLLMAFAKYPEMGRARTPLRADREYRFFSLHHQGRKMARRECTPYQLAILERMDTAAHDGGFDL